MSQYDQERQLDLNVPVLAKIRAIIDAKRVQGNDVASTRNQASIVGLSIEQYLAILGNTATAEELLVLANQWNLLSDAEPEVEEPTDWSLIRDAGADPLLGYITKIESDLSYGGEPPTLELLLMHLGITQAEYVEVGSDNLSDQLRTKLIAQWKLA